MTMLLRSVDELEMLHEDARSERGWHDLESRLPVRWESLLGDRDFVGVVNIVGEAAEGRSIEIGRLAEPIRALIDLLEEELRGR